MQQTKNSHHQKNSSNYPLQLLKIQQVSCLLINIFSVTILMRRSLYE